MKRFTLPPMKFADRVSLIVAIVLTLGSVSLLARTPPSSIQDSPSGWYSIVVGIAGGLFGAGMFFGLLKGKIDLMGYRLQRIEKRLHIDDEVE